MKLTEAEIQYLKRFEFETFYNLSGPGTVHAECQELFPGTASYLGYMADLATPDIQYQVMHIINLNDPDFSDPTPYLRQFPKTSFPWASLEALQQRVLELDPCSQPHNREST